MADKIQVLIREYEKQNELIQSLLDKAMKDEDLNSSVIYRTVQKKVENFICDLRGLL